MLIAHFFTLSFRKKILTFFTQIKRYTFNFSESKYWNQDLINYKNEVHSKLPSAKLVAFRCPIRASCFAAS